jgi:hypothetical protein
MSYEIAKIHPNFPHSTATIHNKNQKILHNL